MSTNAISIWRPLDGTTRIGHARSGNLLAYYNAWHFQPPEGAAPSFLNRALTHTGFCQDENLEPDRRKQSGAALRLLEREFGVALSPEIARDALSTVSPQRLQD
ncbi:hypothetical protein ABZ804_30390 [Streptomyces sp. NPDC047726]|uniref:hypothetical protein n=1 Tax=Streptomyces sp. NPDC047726 TaxID=3156651 RepID=UPI0033F15AF8